MRHLMQPQMHHSRDRPALPAQQKGAGAAPRNKALYQDAAVLRRISAEPLAAFARGAAADYGARGARSRLLGVGLDEQGLAEPAELGFARQTGSEIDQQIGWQMRPRLGRAAAELGEKRRLGPAPGEHGRIDRRRV